MEKKNQKQRLNFTISWNNDGCESSNGLNRIPIVELPPPPQCLHVHLVPLLLWVQRCDGDTEDKQKEGQYNSADNVSSENHSGHARLWWAMVPDCEGDRIVQVFAKKLTWRRRSAAAIREVCLTNTDKLIRTVWSSLSKRLKWGRCIFTLEA